ncbi:MAG TPA: GNAT family N-acetyltransferase, partial [Terracidiphilus sp.]
MFLRETGESAVCAGLRPWSMDPETLEAGVNLMRSAWGLRLGEEALLALLAHGFDTLDLPVIVAGHGIAHDNSRKLLERVGFKYTQGVWQVLPMA